LLQRAAAWAVAALAFVVLAVLDVSFFANLTGNETVAGGIGLTLGAIFYGVRAFRRRG